MYVLYVSLWLVVVLVVLSLKIMSMNHQWRDEVPYFSILTLISCLLYWFYGTPCCWIDLWKVLKVVVKWYVLCASFSYFESSDLRLYHIFLRFASIGLNVLQFGFDSCGFFFWCSMISQNLLDSGGSSRGSWFLCHILILIVYDGVCNMFYHSAMLRKV